MPSDARLAQITDRLTPDLVALRKQLHQHPELAFEEHETAKLPAR
jgi:metal-dependent amidase/aminoacylase/carboxypeptidase family protein